MGVIKAAAWAGLLVCMTLIFKTLGFLFVPFFISLLLCYALGIPLEFLQRFKIPGSLRIILVVLFILFFIFLKYYFSMR